MGGGDDGNNDNNECMIAGMAMIGLTGAQRGVVSKQQSTNLACIAAPNDKSKAGGATTTTTDERGGKNWGNDQVNKGARSGQGETMTTKTTTTTNDNKGMMAGMPSTLAPAEDGDSSSPVGV